MSNFAPQVQSDSESAPPPSTFSPDEARRLAELEALWQEKFVAQPKLPTSALLTGAVSMALAFGFVLFLLSVRVRQFAWIWIALSVAMGLINRFLARHWYQKIVIPWDTERKATAAELKQLEERKRSAS